MKKHLINKLQNINLKAIFLIIVILSVNISMAQNKKRAEKEFSKALEYLNTYRDELAIKHFQLSLRYDSLYPHSLLALAEIYYNKKNDNNSKLLSYKYYEKLVNNHPDFDPNSHVRVGDYYLSNYEIDKSEYHYQYALEKLNTNRYLARREYVKKQLSKLDFVRYALDNPVEFKPRNIGNSINTDNDEYFPTLVADETSLIFTRQTPNPDTTNKREPYYEDFYVSNKVKNTWGKAELMPPPFNSNVNEGALSISPDGKDAYFARCNAKDGYGSCDIYVSTRKGDKWSEPKNLGAKVNSAAWDSQPSIASDSRTLFFVSSRPGGLGNSDIWYTYKGENGEWSEAKNLGNIINTPGDEMFPFIHPSNTTLYFSSDYHIGMGSQDIFYSRLENGEFTTPINLGYPINTSSSETSFIVSPSGKEAYFSTDLEGGYGKKDLYVFNLYEEAQPTPIVYMKGRVLDITNNNPVYASFEVRDLETNKLIASTTSDASNGSYLVVLPLGGDYALNAKADNYLFYSENFQLKSKEIESYEKDVFLNPILEGNSVVLNNVFFESNSAELLPSSQAELLTLVGMLKDNPNIIIEISGHTDNTGNAAMNLELSNKRAINVKLYLQTKGISPNRLQAKGYGQTMPIDDNNTEEGKAKNRRTEFKIISR